MVENRYRDRIASIKKRVAEFDFYYMIIPLCICALLFVFGAFTGKWPWSENSFNSFALQADSWLHGRLDVDGTYTWLELAIYDNLYYVSFPPFPSYVLLPFAVFFGSNTPDGIISMIFSFIGAIYAYRLCKEFLGEERRSDSFLLSMLLYLGSNTIFFLVSGWVWFFAQNLSFTFTILAVFYAVKAKPGRSFAFWACAVGCRPFQIIFLPVLVMLMVRTWKQNEKDFSLLNKIKTQWYKGIPCLVIAISYCILNYMRFGNIMEFGHNYLPEFTRTEEGQFNIAYLAENLRHMFRLPVPQESGALSFYNADGVAFWLVNPILIVFLITMLYRIIKKRDMDTLISGVIFLLACSYIIILCMHRTLGGWHFGNRYTCDMLPVVLAGILLSMPKSEKFMALPKLVFIFGFALNLVGTIATYNYWV